MTSKRATINALAEGAHTEEGRPEVGTTATRSKDVRLTLDLDPLVHRQLTGWCNDAASKLDKPKVPAVQVVRALLDLMLNDPDLSARVLRAVRQ